MTTHSIAYSAHTLKASDAQRLFNARTIDQATKLGWIDAIIDWFHAGARKETLADVFEKFQRATGTLEGLGVQGDELILAKASALRKLMLVRSDVEFQFGVKLDEKAGTYAVSLKAGKKTLWTRSDLSTGDKLSTLSDHAQHTLLLIPEISLKATQARECLTQWRDISLLDSLCNRAANQLGLKFPVDAVKESLRVSFDVVNSTSIPDVSPHLGLAMKCAAFAGATAKFGLPCRLTFTGPKECAFLVGTAAIPLRFKSESQQSDLLNASVLTDVLQTLQSNDDLFDDPQEYVRMVVDSMLDGDGKQVNAQRKAIRELLDDPRCTSDSFVGAVPSMMYRQRIDFEDVSFDVSDGNSDKFPMRGTKLCETMKNRSFTSLRDLITRNSLTAEDPVLCALLGPVASRYHENSSPCANGVIDDSWSDLTALKLNFGKNELDLTQLLRAVSSPSARFPETLAHPSQVIQTWQRLLDMALKDMGLAIQAAGNGRALRGPDSRSVAPSWA